MLKEASSLSYPINITKKFLSVFELNENQDSLDKLKLFNGKLDDKHYMMSSNAYHKLKKDVLNESDAEDKNEGRYASSAFKLLSITMIAVSTYAYIN